MTMSQYLGRGSKSRGRMTITSGLSTRVADDDVPYLKDDYDKQAVIQGILNLQLALSSVEGLNWSFPNASTTVEDFVDAVSDLLLPPPFPPSQSLHQTKKMEKFGQFSNLLL